MPDNTPQGGTDLLATDHVSKLNDLVIVPAVDTPKVQQVKIGYAPAENEYRDVSPAYSLPVGAGVSPDLVQVFNSAGSATTPTVFDTLGYRWISLVTTAGYVGMTALTSQCSFDGTNWFTAAMCSSANTSSGITASLGIAAAVYHGPAFARYFRVIPSGAYGSGSCTVTIRLHTQPLWMNSSGVNASITNLQNATITVGTGGGQMFYAKQSGSGVVALTTLQAAAAGVVQYVTDIDWYNTGTVDTILTLQAASNPTIVKEYLLKAGQQDWRAFKVPWKVTSTTNVALQYAISAATTSWQFNVHGYYG